MSVLQLDGLTIRSAIRSEAEYLSDLALRSKAYWGYSRDFMTDCRQELSYTQQQIEQHEYSFVVAELEGAIAGFFAIEQLSATEFELEALFVEPLYIGRGIGRALMARAKQMAAELGGEMLIVQSDPHAEGFYRALGGQPTGRRESDSIPGRYLSTFAIPLQYVAIESDD
ncbi:MAG: GNAT family N-acetyltransferase [Cyanobacteria bacterium J06642_2]